MTTLEEIDDLLPQTQCRQCGCDGCLAYARAILEEGAAINRCAPGGAEGIARLAAATDRPVVPLDPSTRELVARLSKITVPAFMISAPDELSVSASRLAPTAGAGPPAPSRWSMSISAFAPI